MAPREGIWPGPSGPTVLEDQVRKGLQRASNPAAGMAPSGGGPLGGPVRAAAGTQDMVMGLLQALLAPATSALSVASPLLERAGKLPVSPSIGEENLTLMDVAQGARKIPGAIGEAGGRAIGYPAEQSKELGENFLTPFGSLAKVAGPATVGAMFLPFGHLFKHSERTKQELEMAQLLESEGVAPEDIFAETQILRHPTDNDWRKEISDFDSGMKLTPQELYDAARNGDILRSGDVYDHRGLYRIAPWMKDFETWGNGGKSGASYLDNEAPDQSNIPGYIQHRVNPSPGTIELGLRAGRDSPVLTESDDLARTMLHELQHGVQAKNPNSSTGATYTPETRDVYLRDAGETESRLVESRKLLDNDQRKLLYPYSKDMTQLIIGGDKAFGQGMRGVSAYRSRYTNDELIRTHPASFDRTMNWIDFWDRLDQVKKGTP